MTVTASEYHRQTSYTRNKIGGHAMDWANQPDVFKTFPDAETVSLPKVISLPDENLSEVLSVSADEKTAPRLNTDRLSQILMLAHALTAKARYAGVEFYFRNVASAGALYPFEIYVGARNVKGLNDGVYHHSLALHALARLRKGDPDQAAAHAIEGRSERTPPTLRLFLTSIFFRSSWKYRDRAYRYNLLDTGHLVENLTLALTSMGFPYRLRYDFDDEKVNDLLCLDSHREVCLAVVEVWSAEDEVVPVSPPLGSAHRDLPEAGPIAAVETDYPLIRDAHAGSASVKSSSRDHPKMLDSVGLDLRSAEPLPDIENRPEVLNYADAVMKRRSSRNFVPEELSAGRLVALLDSLCADYDGSGGPRLSVGDTLAVGFLSGSVEDLDPGFYMLDLDAKEISLVREGRFLNEMTHICLDQGWLANCALHFVFLTNIGALERRFGPRAYRHAMLNAGRLGQRLYVAATSMKLGCCGIGAFFDDEAASLLGVDNETSMLYLVAAGPLRKWSDMKR